MANLKEIRKRIRSVKNMQKITSAMKMVAAAKLKRAQDAIQAARPYGQKLKEVMSGLAALVEADAHPLLRQAPEQGGTALIVVLTSDRGLCGGFNATILREVDRFRKNHAELYDSIHLKVIGKKGRDWYKRQTPENLTTHPELLLGGVTFALAKGVASELLEAYIDGTYDHIFIAYNEFQSAMTQHQRVDQLLPIESKAIEQEESDAQATDTIFEPDRDAMLAMMLPKYIEIQVHRAMLDSAASEQGSRMTAMDSATNNAKDMIADLTLQRNRARQAAITKELVEITSGAEALHG